MDAAIPASLVSGQCTWTCAAIASEPMLEALTVLMDLRQLAEALWLFRLPLLPKKHVQKQLLHNMKARYITSPNMHVVPL